jgi:hypothetical protein
MSDTGDWLRRGWNNLVLGFDAARQRQLLRPLGLEEIDPGRLVVLFVGASVLALLWMAWLTARAERERDPLLRAWHEVGQRYARHGLGRLPHEPALAWAERVSRARPALAAGLEELTRRFSKWRYAVQEAGGCDVEELIRDLRRHRPKP